MMKMRIKMAVFCAATLSCGGTPPEATAPEAVSDLELVETPFEATPTKTVAKKEARTVEVSAKPLPRAEVARTTRVFETPSLESYVLGVITRGTVVEVVGTKAVAQSEGNRKRRRGCRTGWTEIKPRGWLCVETKSTKATLSKTPMPRLDRRRAVPGTAGKIRDGRLIFADQAAVLADDGKVASGESVRMAGTVRIGDTVYWETSEGQLVAARDVRRSRGSSFEGVFVDSDSELRLPIAFAHKERARARNVPIYDEPGGRRIGKLEPREAVNIDHVTHNGRWLRLEGDGWISGRDARYVDKAEPPETVGAKETWLDFNRDTQTVVVYRGKDPIYATLTSSGKYGHRTPVGVYRVEKKVAKTTMNSRPDAEEPYEVKNVPWSLFFHHGYAVHGAYWHNKFGTPVSHGCLNLAPTDAKVVYEALGPRVPAGWSVATSTAGDPGAIVRVKTNKRMNPPLRGSAVRHKEATASRALAAR